MSTATCTGLPVSQLGGVAHFLTWKIYHLAGQRSLGRPMVMLAALLLHCEAAVPDRQTGELITPSMPLSMQELGDVIVAESSLDGNTVQTLDGQTVGTLRSDGSVTVSPTTPSFPSWQDVNASDATIIGLMNADGSVALSSVSGLPLDSVVSSQSTVSGTTVRTAAGRLIGYLQNDGATVLNSDGSFVGARQVDGAVVGGSIARVLAAPDPHDSWSWADTAALTMTSQFVCKVSQLPEAHAADHPALENLEDLLLPNGTHLLIYGPSHVASVREVLTSVARYFKHRVTSSLLSNSDDCDSSSDGSPRSPAKEVRCGILADRPCQDTGLRREEIEGRGGYATITSVSNHAQYQLPNHADELEKLIAETYPPFTHAYFMHPHRPDYFKTQCKKATSDVRPDLAAMGDAAEKGTLCNIATPECQASTAQFAPFAKWLPQVGVRGGIGLKHDNDPKSAAARIFDTHRHFVLGHGGDPSFGEGELSQQVDNYDHGEHACNIICAGAGTEEQACAPAEGLALAWEVLRSAGVRKCFQGWTGCDPLTTAPAYRAGKTYRL